MRTLVIFTLVLAAPALATSLDGKKLERLLGLGRTGDVTPVEATPAPLPWRLLGTMRARDGFSIAAVECSSKSVTLAVGDVRDGVEVVSIEQQLLTVRRMGRLEQIGWRVVAPTLMVPAGARPLSRAVVEQLMQNPAALMEQAQLFPALIAGRLSGFRARWVKEGSLVASLGLKAGDVIMKVNGQPLDNMERLFSLLQGLASARRFEVELERNGQRLVESVELDR